MAWTIAYSPDALYNLAKLSKAIAGRITKFIDKCLAVPTEPKALGKKLEGDSTTASIAGYYRILGTVERQTVHILIVATGHRSKIQKTIRVFFKMNLFK